MLVFLGVAFLVSAAHAAVTSKIESVTPDYLDTLLREGRYDEFSYLLGIPDPSLARELPASERAKNKYPRFNPALGMGDMLIRPNVADEERQGIDFNRWGFSKWPVDRSDGIIKVPVTISNNFTEEETKQIFIGLLYFNSEVKHIRFVNYKGQTDYVYIYPGEGCWSDIGRRGKQQSSSLGRYSDCFRKGTVAHEMAHAIGMSHEHTRLDRDDYIEMHWNNVPEAWKSQFVKNDASIFKDYLQYDYYSLMHYQPRLPGTFYDAFTIKKEVANKSIIGYVDDFTKLDIRKIYMTYGFRQLAENEDDNQ